MEKSKYVEILKKRDFSAFLFGLLAFRLGDILFTVGVYWWILKATDSEAFLGIVGMLPFIPMAIFSLFSGVVADHTDRRRLLVFSALSRGLLIPVVPLLYSFGLLEVWHIFVLVFLQGASSSFFVVSSSAIVPQLVSEEQLLAANSLIDVSSWVGNIAGFLIGGILVESLGPMNFLLLAPFMLVVSSLFMILIRTKSQETRMSTSMKTIVGDLGHGLNTIRKDRAVWTLIITWMGIQMFFAGGPMSIGWPVFSEKILHAGAQGYGFLISGISISALLGSVFMGQWGTNRNKGRLILLGYLWGSIGMFLLSLTNILWIALIVASLWNVCFPMINIPFMTLMQERISKKELGTAFGVANLMSSFLTPISIVMTGFIMERSILLPFQLFAGGLGLCFILTFSVKEAREAK